MTSEIQNGEGGLSVRTKLNEVIVDVNALNVEGGLLFDTVAALLANTSLTYASGNVVAGNILQTSSEGFAYQVAASSATDQHVTTAGGVKLYVLQISASRVSPLQFGSPCNGVDDDSAALAACFSAAVANDWTVDLGDYTYINGTVGLTRTPLLVTLGAGQNFILVGNGAVIRDRDGLTNAIGSFNRTISVNVPDGVTAGFLSFEGFEIDKRGSTVTVTPGASTYEQAHCLAIYTTGTTSKYASVTCRDIITRDKVGGGIVFASGAADDVLVENCHGVDYAYAGAERGDLEFQMTVKQGSVVACSGRFTQLEHNVSTPNASIVNPTLMYMSCQYRTFDLIGFSGDLQAQKFVLDGVSNGSDGNFWFRNCVAEVYGSRLRTTGTVDWRNTICNWIGGEIIVGVDTGTNEFQSLNISGTTLTLVNVRFSGTKFSADATADGSTTGYAVRASAAVPAASVGSFLVGFTECVFSTAFQHTADCYRNGTWEFDNCSLASRAAGWAIQAGGDTTNAGNVTINGCDLSQVAGSLVRINAAGASAWRLTFAGVMDYAKFSMTNRPATEYQDTKVTHNGYWLSDARPAAGGLNGQIVKLRKPTVGLASEFVVSVGSITAATFRSSAQAGTNKGVTGSRPAPNANDIGLQYLDTTLDADGTPIWWNGTTWVDIADYNQGGTGAVTRTVQNRLRDFVSVKDFGAVGNGVADDTAAIQAAVTAQQGKSLYFPSGVYVNSANPSGADDVLMTGEPFTTFSGTKLPLHNPIFTGNKQVALVAAALRYYTTADGVATNGWYLIQAKSGAFHDPVLLGPVTATGTGSLTLDVDFEEFGIDPNIWTPSGFVCGPDETFTEEGVIFGASVGTTSVTITGNFVGDRTCILTWTTDGVGGGALTGINAPYIFTTNPDGIVSGWVGSGANRYLRIYRDPATTRKAFNANSKTPIIGCRRSTSTVIPVQGSFRANATTTVGSNTYEYFDVFVDKLSDGTQITDATNVTFALTVSDPLARAVPFTFDVEPASGSNIWMVGVFTRKSTEYP